MGKALTSCLYSFISSLRPSLLPSSSLHPSPPFPSLCFGLSIIHLVHILSLISSFSVPLFIRLLFSFESLFRFPSMPHPSSYIFYSLPPTYISSFSSAAYPPLRPVSSSRLSILFIYCLFNDAASNFDHLAPINRMINK
jgi:hypothetical protein